MPKSTDIPINKTAKAIEMMFSLPTVTEVIPKVIIKPIKIENNRESIIFIFLKEIARTKEIKIILKIEAFIAP